MKTRTTKPFDITRVREFCKLINEGKTPNEALIKMKACQNYRNPLESAGIFWIEKDGNYKAVERIYLERYELFIEEKRKYLKKRNEVARWNKNQRASGKINSFQKRNSYKEYVKQATLFNQPKQKQTTTTAPTMKAKQRELSFIQRVVKSLFKL
jgi:hypothetical protein